MPSQFLRQILMSSLLDLQNPASLANLATALVVGFITPTRLCQQMGPPNGTEVDREQVGCLQLLLTHPSPKRSLRRTLRLMTAKTRGMSGSLSMEVKHG